MTGTPRWRRSICREVYGGQPFYDAVACVLSVHNAGYQGLFDPEILEAIGLPEKVFHWSVMEYYGKLNWLKGGLAHADWVTTVSPTHAHELRTPAGGFGLHDSFIGMGDRLRGILNGIDQELWNPATDPEALENYSRDDLSGKRVCKAWLQELAGLPVNPDIPLVGMTARLAKQKGFDLILGDGLLYRMDGAQFIFLGEGDRGYKQQLQEVAGHLPDRVAAFFEFTEEREHRLLAGADILLMPSQYEPCGLTQMRAQRYGALPVVRRVGGLSDTVEDQETGFVFDGYTSEALEVALRRAFATYRDRERVARAHARGHEPGLRMGAFCAQIPAPLRGGAHGPPRPVSHDRDTPGVTMNRSCPWLPELPRRLQIAALVLFLVGCGSQGELDDGAVRLTGDWDYYRMLGAAPNGGFEARRRFGFAHFEGADPAQAFLHRRAGGSLETVTGVALAGDSVTVDFASGTSLRAEVRGDTVAGVLVRDGAPADRVWLVRRSSLPAYEPYYPLWGGEVSDSTYAVTIDPAVPMTARDGTILMNFVGRPMGQGPFGVVMERTPYLRIDTANAVFWASRGYIYVKQDVRGRGGSGGVLDMNAMQEQDGYDAVEWAAGLPGSNGKVGMVGRSNPGLYTWYAAIAQPPHLTTIAPVVATADPLRLVPYIDMVFSPTIIPWLCLTAVKETLSDISNVDEVTAFNQLPGHRER